MRRAVFVIYFLVSCLSTRAFADGVCEEFQTGENPDGVICSHEFVFPWIAFGGGYSTTFKWANVSSQTAKSKVQIQMSIVPASGWRAPDGHYQDFLAILTDNNAPVPYLSAPINVYLLWMPKDGSIEITLLYTPAGCDQYGQNCQNYPDPDDKLSVGSARFWLYSYVKDGAPATLRNLSRPSAQVNYKGGLQATMQALDPSKGWIMPVNVKFDRNKSDFAFVINNPNAYEITAKGRVLNRNGQILGEQTWVLPSVNLKALYLSDAREGFGQGLFPDGKDLTGVFEIWADSPSDGKFSAVGFQLTGNAFQPMGGVMSNADIQPFIYIP